jgi:hypothetical protein
MQTNSARITLQGWKGALRGLSHIPTTEKLILETLEEAGITATILLDCKGQMPGSHALQLKRVSLQKVHEGSLYLQTQVGDNTTALRIECHLLANELPLNEIEQLLTTHLSAKKPRKQRKIYVEDEAGAAQAITDLDLTKVWDTELCNEFQIFYVDHYSGKEPLIGLPELRTLVDLLLDSKRPDIEVSTGVIRESIEHLSRLGLLAPESAVCFRATFLAGSMQPTTQPVALPTGGTGIYDLLNVFKTIQTTEEQIDKLSREREQAEGDFARTIRTLNNEKSKAANSAQQRLRDIDNELSMPAQELSHLRRQRDELDTKIKNVEAKLRDKAHDIERKKNGVSQQLLDLQARMTQEASNEKKEHENRLRQIDQSLAALKESLQSPELSAARALADTLRKR